GVAVRPPRQEQVPSRGLERGVQGGRAAVHSSAPRTTSVVSTVPGGCVTSGCGVLRHPSNNTTGTGRDTRGVRRSGHTIITHKERERLESESTQSGHRVDRGFHDRGTGGFQPLTGHQTAGDEQGLCPCLTGGVRVVVDVADEYDLG